MVAKIQIYARPQSIKQARRPEFYKYVDFSYIVLCYMYPHVAWPVHWCTYCQNFDSKIRRDHQKISYERRVYESVDDRSLSLKPTKK